MKVFFRAQKVSGWNPFQVPYRFEELHDPARERSGSSSGGTEVSEGPWLSNSDNVFFSRQADIVVLVSADHG